MPSPFSLETPLLSIPSTPTSFESTCESFGPASPLPVGRGPKVLNGRLVKSKPRQSTSSSPLLPAALGSPSPLTEGKKDQREDLDDDDNHDNDNDNDVNGNGHVNATKEPQKHSRDKEVKSEKPGSGTKIWKLVKRISTGGLRDKYRHSPSFSMSSPTSGKASAARVVAGAAVGGGIGGVPRSLSRATQLKVTKLSNYSEESLAFTHQSNGSCGSLVASSSHGSHGESSSGPALLGSFNTFHHDHTPPPVPAIPKDLQIPHNYHHLQTPNILLSPSVGSSPSSPASLSFSEPGSNMSRKYRRDRDSRSASSPIPSISSPLSPGQLSPASHSSANPSSPLPHTPSPSPNKKRILSRISSMGLLRRKPSISSGLASSLGFGALATGTSGTSGTLDKVEKSGKNEKMENDEKDDNNEAAAQEVPALFTIPKIPSIPSTPDNPSTTASKPKSAKYSISCIPIPSIPSMPSMSILASSTPSTPIKSTTPMQISFSSSSSRPGTGKSTLSHSSSASSPRVSSDSRSRSHSRLMGMLAMQSGRRRRRSKSMSRSRSRSSSLDSLGRRHNRRNHDNHAHTTPTRNKKNHSNHRQDRNNQDNNNNSHNHNHNAVPIPPHLTTITNMNNNNNDHPYPLAKHIVPPLELSGTLGGGDDDNRWGVEQILSGEDDQGYAGTTASSSSVSLPATGHINGHNGQSGNGSHPSPQPDPPFGRRDGVSVDLGLGPKRSINNRSTGSNGKLEENKREEKTVMMDKWERLLERVEKWDKLDLDKLDGLKSRRTAVHAGRESWTIVRSPEQEELPSLPVPPRRRTKEKESRREKEKESSREEKWERSASVDIPASPVSSSPVYGGRADTPAPSTFGRVMGKQIEVEGSMEETRRSSSPPIQGRASFSAVGDGGRDSRKKIARDGSRKRRSLSAVRLTPVLISSSSKDGQSNMAPPSPRSWTKSLPSPTRRENSENAADVVAVASTTTSPVPAAATPPRALGSLFRKLSFSGVSSGPAGGTEKRHNKSPRRPSIGSSISPAKSRSVSISGGRKSGVFQNGSNGDNNKQGGLESSSSSSTFPLPRRLLRKNSLLKGRSSTSNQDKDDMQDKLPTIPLAMRMRNPRTSDVSPSTSNNNDALTEKEKRERWEYLLEKTEKAGGTIHLHANGEGLLSDKMRMSMVSVVSEVSGAQVGVQEGDY